MSRMLNFRRALIAAAFILIVLFLFTRSHSSPDSPSAPAIDLKNDGPKVDAKGPSVDDAGIRPGPGASTAYSTSTSQKLATTGIKKPVKNQQVIQDMSHLSLIDKLAYQFPYDLETKFPAYIWQTWKYTPASGEFEEAFRASEASWSEKNPGFIHEVITDQVAVHLMRHLYASVPEVLEAYNAMPLPILKADFFRYLILLARGGIYTDIDTYALKSVLEWIPETVPHTAIGLVVGIEADPDRPDWAEWYSRRIQFCQWTIQSKPGHPVLRDIVAKITHETLRRKKTGTLKTTDDGVVEYTGPAIWTDTIFEFFNNPRYFDIVPNSPNITWKDFTGMTAPKKVGDVVVLPITSFSPGVQQMGAQDYDDPMAFVKHDFEGTWKPEHLRHIGSESTEQEA